MNKFNPLRKQFTYPYRYVRLSRQIIVRNPYKLRTNIKKVTFQCVPGLVSEVVNETILSSVKSTFPDIIQHYVMGLCLNTIITIFIVNVYHRIENSN